MPELFWRSLTALRYSRRSASCVALADALGTVSPDRLTRRLPSAWSGHSLLDLACRTRCAWERGDLLIDATVMPKPFATALAGLAWGFSSREGKPVSGLAVVLLVWTNGRRRLPRGLRLWRKGGPSKYALAREVLR